MSDHPPAPATPAPPQSAPAAQVLFVIAPRAIMAVLMLVALGINIANVITRYLFSFALYWGEEIMIYLTIWCVGLGIVVSAYRGTHLNMDLISGRARSPFREIVNGFIAVVFIAVCGFVAAQSFIVVRLLFRSGQVSVAGAVPMYIPHSAILVGFTMMSAAVLYRWRSYFTGRF
jgi:TRAP-type C4-dicarboxylate transport system permease small subunit